MGSEVIKAFLVSLGFGVNDGELAAFNKAITSATIKVTALYGSIQLTAAGIFKGLSSISEGFEKMGYEYRLIAPAISKTLELRHAMLEAYSKAGINILEAVQASVKFNFSLAKTKMAFEAIYKSVGVKFLPLLTQQMDVFRTKIYANMPKIQKALENFVKFIFKAFEATVQLGTTVWSILGRVWDFFSKLDEATAGWSTKILLAIAAWQLLNLSFLATPLGMLLTGLLAILALYDDFKVWKEGGESLINWGSTAVRVIASVAAGIGILAAAIGTVMLALRAWAAAQWLVNIALTANPIGLIVLAVSALVIALTALAMKLGYLKGLSSFLGGVGDKVGSFMGGIGGKILGEGGGANNVNNMVQPQPLIGGAGNSNSQKVNQETNINIQGSPDANATAKAVSGEQSKVNFDMTRNLKGAAR